VPIVLKSENLNLLEPSGPVKACNGVALPLPFTFTHSLKEKDNLVEVGLNGLTLKCALGKTIPLQAWAGP
jgi:hypothetical protein